MTIDNLEWKVGADTSAARLYALTDQQVELVRAALGSYLLLAYEVVRAKDFEKGKADAALVSAALSNPIKDQPQ